MRLLRWIPLFLLILVRLHNLTVYPSSYGYDAYAHNRYVLQVSQGAVPEANQGWADYHPPLYYLVCVQLGRVLGWNHPQGALQAAQLTSTLSGLGVLALTAVIAIRLDRRLLWPSVLLVACLPTEIIVAPMVYNMAMGEFLSVLFLFVFLEAWRESDLRLWREVALGLICGLGLLTRPEALVMPVMLGLLWLARLRSAGRRADATLILGLQGALSLGLAGWRLTRNLASFGRFFYHNADPDAFPLYYTGMDMTLPGFLSPSFYISADGAIWQHPYFPSGYPSFLETLYASAWWDYFHAFITRFDIWGGRTMLFLGLVPTLMVLGGVGVVLARRESSGWPPLVAMLGLAALLDLGITLKLPVYCAVKATYLYPGFVPAALLAGRAWLEARAHAPRAARALEVWIWTTGMASAWLLWL